jgi:hypothetical protein
VRGWVEQRFSVEIMVRHYVELYERILTDSLDLDSQLGFVKEIAA